jgi:AcrR family transcriptional regulator
MRAAIVDVAYSLVEEGGAEAVSIREIARRIEYSLRTIYLYFRDKKAILDAVRERGFTELAAYLAAAMEADYAESVDRLASERLRRLGRAYLAFAKERKNLFGVMYFREPPVARRIPAGCDDQAPDDTTVYCEDAEASPAFSILTSAVADYLGTRVNDPSIVRSVSFALWGLVHGLSTLALFEQDKEFRGVDISGELDRALTIMMP